MEVQCCLKFVDYVTCTDMAVFDQSSVQNTDTVTAAAAAACFWPLRKSHYSAEKETLYIVSDIVSQRAKNTDPAARFVDDEQLSQVTFTKCNQASAMQCRLRRRTRKLESQINTTLMSYLLKFAPEMKQIYE